MLTDSSKLWRLDAKMLSVVPGVRSLAGYPPCSGVHAPSIMSHRKTNTERYFHFSPFSLKEKILLRFLLVSENRYYYRSLVKVNWHKMNF